MLFAVVISSYLFGRIGPWCLFVYVVRDINIYLGVHDNV